MSVHHIPDREITERPAGYEGPNLSPIGLRLAAHRYDEGVYGLIANLPPKDNNGLIVGRDSAMIVDSGITTEIAVQLQGLAADLTDVPVRYLANTTYHGDHTFGNAAFPDEVTVISSRLNKENMGDLAYEQMTRSRNMYGDEYLLKAMTRWRKPDVVFDSFAEVDLGGRTVQLWQFGPGNGPGDTIVYVPDTKIAWTGNFLCHAGTAPMLLQGGPAPYLESLRRMRETLPDLRTIVPGHGPAGDGIEGIDWLIAYLERLQSDVVRLHEDGHTMEETLERAFSPYTDGLDPRLVRALAEYDIPQHSARENFLKLCRSLHQLNVLVTYRLLQATGRPASR
ncbi:MBL fold metallo-hydrolase [Nonomuraea sp. NN258]|uniref:MBL fold metallo-hydrolase n=1 Tax=Nonomuraea antri TaxID=2730852 RepID=UPI001569758F|nr:MBL fold metallo-hydrolase [Nonomuraea antri]NRQ36525.1 MBL fold metallo-hydrolase [Nonomuraea antri]